MFMTQGFLFKTPLLLMVEWSIERNFYFRSELRNLLGINTFFLFCILQLILFMRTFDHIDFLHDDPGIKVINNDSILDLTQPFQFDPPVNHSTLFVPYYLLIGFIHRGFIYAPYQYFELMRMRAHLYSEHPIPDMLPLSTPLHPPQKDAPSILHSLPLDFFCRLQSQDLSPTDILSETNALYSRHFKSWSVMMGKEDMDLEEMSIKIEELVMGASRTTVHNAYFKRMGGDMLSGLHGEEYDYREEQQQQQQQYKDDQLKQSMHREHRKQLQYLRKEICKYQKETEKLMAESNALKMNNAGLKIMCNNARTEQEYFKNQKMAQDKEIGYLKKELVSLKEQIKSGEFSCLKCSYYMENQKSIQNKYQFLKKEKENLEIQIQKIKDNFNIIELQLHRSSYKNQQMKEQIKKLNIKKKDQTTSDKQANQEYLNLKQNLQNMKTLLQQKKKENSNIRKQQDKLKVQFQHLKENENRMKQYLNKATKQSAEMQQQIIKLKQQTDRYRQKLQKVQLQLIKMNEQAKKIRQDSLSTKIQSKYIKEESYNIKRQSTNLQSELYSIRQQYKKIKEQAQVLRIQSNIAREQLFKVGISFQLSKLTQKSPTDQSMINKLTKSSQLITGPQNTLPYNSKKVIQPQKSKLSQSQHVSKLPPLEAKKQSVFKLPLKQSSQELKSLKKSTITQTPSQNPYFGLSLDPTRQPQSRPCSVRIPFQSPQNNHPLVYQEARSSSVCKTDRTEEDKQRNGSPNPLTHSQLLTHEYLAMKDSGKKRDFPTSKSQQIKESITNQGKTIRRQSKNKDSGIHNANSNNNHNNNNNNKSINNNHNSNTNNSNSNNSITRLSNMNANNKQQVNNGHQHHQAKFMSKTVNMNDSMIKHPARISFQAKIEGSPNPPSVTYRSPQPFSPYPHKQSINIPYTQMNPQLVINGPYSTPIKAQIHSQNTPFFVKATPSFAKPHLHPENMSSLHSLQKSQTKWDNYLKIQHNNNNIHKPIVNVMDTKQQSHQDSYYTQQKMTMSPKVKRQEERQYSRPTPSKAISASQIPQNHFLKKETRIDQGSALLMQTRQPLHCYSPQHLEKSFKPQLDRQSSLTSILPLVRESKMDSFVKGSSLKLSKANSNQDSNLLDTQDSGIQVLQMNFDINCCAINQ